MDTTTTIILALIGPTFGVIISSIVGYWQIKISLAEIQRNVVSLDSRVTKLEGHLETHKGEDMRYSAELSTKLEGISVMREQLHNLQTTVSEIKEELKENRRYRNEEVRK